MESLRELYRIGNGPSSSHTMGPISAVREFLKRYPNTEKAQVELYGSLAATGKGHLTDIAIKEEFKKKGVEVTVIWHPEVILPYHPNALKIKSGKMEEIFYSVGGGKIVKEGEENRGKGVYKETTFSSILSYCDKKAIQLWQLSIEEEGEEILTYMDKVWKVMVSSIKRGIAAEGVLPGALLLQRKASLFHAKATISSGPIAQSAYTFSYALAVAEENASGAEVVTAPTCGSAGVLPAVLYHLKNEYKISKEKILKALLTAGIVGNLVKENGSISGAEVGCQGEIGVASAMAGAAATQLLGGTIYQIEYAAEMGLEHHLGLTCDPLLGLVQIPCIERNALAAMRAINHATYALMMDGRHKIGFDDVVRVMKETGHALPSLYRETGKGGLAKLFNP